MKKLLFQAIISISLFFSIWVLLSNINWITIFQVEQVQQNTEEKLGVLYWELFNEYDGEIKDIEVLAPLDSILSRICPSNDIDRSQIKLHIVKSDEINAFALPDKHLVIYSGLLLTIENEAELTGVICHEIAHMQKNHVMKKLIKEVGLSLLISMTSSKNGGTIIKETAKLLSSSSYDRRLEKEADITAVEYLINSSVDAKPFAEFLFRLGLNNDSNLEIRTWVSSHPNSEIRAQYILKKCLPESTENNNILNSNTWDKLIECLKK
jgi:predicted Zn-dependent protease